MIGDPQTSNQAVRTRKLEERVMNEKGRCLKLLSGWVGSTAPFDARLTYLPWSISILDRMLLRRSLTLGTGGMDVGESDILG